MGSMEGNGSSVVFLAATGSSADGSSSILSHDTVHVSRMK